MNRPFVLLVLLVAVVHLVVSLASLMGAVAMGGGILVEANTSDPRQILADALASVFRGLSVPLLLVARYAPGRPSGHIFEWPLLIMNSFVYATLGALILRRWGPAGLLASLERSSDGRRSPPQT